VWLLRYGTKSKPNSDTAYQKDLNDLEQALTTDHTLEVARKIIRFLELTHKGEPEEDEYEEYDDLECAIEKFANEVIESEGTK
jgi:hypothetical protein